MSYKFNMMNEIEESIFRLQNAMELNFPKMVNPIDPCLMRTLKEFSDLMNLLGEKYKINMPNVCKDLRTKSFPQCNFESGEMTIYPHLNYTIIID